MKTGGKRLVISEIYSETASFYSRPCDPSNPSSEPGFRQMAGEALLWGQDREACSLV